MKAKKILSFLLSVVFAVSTLSNMGMIVLADAISYEYDIQTQTITVTGTGSMTDFNENNLIEREWNGYADVAKKVEIGEGITHIGAYSFSRFTVLEEVVIPNSVTSIGTTAFSGNDSLRKIVVPSSVTDIEPYAFGYAYDMTVPEDFVAYCEHKSAAQAYCLENYIMFDAPMQGNSATAHITVAGEQAMWSFVAKTSGTLEFWSTGTKDTYGLIYDASNYVYSTKYSEMKKSAIATGDDNGSDVNFKISLSVEAGKRYYLAAKFMLNDRYDGSSSYEDGRFGVGMRMTCSEHIYEEVERIEPTCTSAGSLVERCVGCGDEVTTVLAQIDHSPAQAVMENVVEASCTQEGSYDLVEYCDYCNTELSREHHTEPMLNHQYGEYVEDNNADCTNNATKTATCTVCGATDTVMIPDSALGHIDGEEEVEILVEPTCTEMGKKRVTIHCTRCGIETYSGEQFIDMLGHSFTNYVSNNDADCIHNGTETAKCDRCDETDTRTVENSALGHAYTVEVIDPTCTETGYTLHTCTRCNDSYMSDFVDALGHIEGEEQTEILVEPTCTEAGTNVIRTYCTRCGENLSTRNVTVDPLGHDFEIVSFDGEIVGTKCSRCDETKDFDFMFRYNTRLEENDDWAVIDVNNDGVINAKDYALIYRMTK